jgi:hypothetical protein
MRELRASWPLVVTEEGIALAFAVDRLAGFDWRRHAFGDGQMTLVEMLDAALSS